MEPAWLTVDVVIALHDFQIEEHGGALGLRDVGLLDSALNRARNLYCYGCEDLFTLAAAYAAGIVQNHAFYDGNKRTSLLASTTFLVLNGWEPTFSEETAVGHWLALAAGQTGETQIADFIRRNVMLLQ